MPKIFIGMPCRAKYRPGEPDGSKCLYCGDEIYLHAFLVDLFAIHDDSFQGTLEGMLCGGCGEEFKKYEGKPLHEEPPTDEYGIPDFL